MISEMKNHLQIRKFSAASNSSWGSQLGVRYRISNCHLVGSVGKLKSSEHITLERNTADKRSDRSPENPETPEGETPTVAETVIVDLNSF